jgi:hypothetical protein
MKKPVLLLIVFFVTIFIFIFINAFLKSRQEYTNKYDFVITEIEINVKGNLTFYDNLNHKYSFASYSFNKFDKLGIEVGDRILKDNCKKNMTISREINNKYEIYYVQKPNGLIPFSFYDY